MPQLSDSVSLAVRSVALWRGVALGIVLSACCSVNGLTNLKATGAEIATGAQTHNFYTIT